MSSIMTLRGYTFSNTSTPTTPITPSTPTTASSIKPLSPLLLLPLVFLALLTPLLALHTYRDYHAFLALGAGGTPHNFGGYLRIKLLALFALRNPRSPAPVPADLRATGYLDAETLGVRRGARPLVRGIAPHRQVSDKMGEGENGGVVFAAMMARLRALAATPAHGLVEGTSCFEKHGTGLFSTRALTRTCRGEVCHIHASDGSLHLTLYPGDAKAVIERGWGERHPLARGGWFRRFVPRGFVMIYAPRDEAEMEVVERIVKASVWWVSGVCVGGEGEGEGLQGRARSEKDDLAREVTRGREDRRDSVTTEKDGFCLGCRRKFDGDSYSAFGS